MPIKTRAPSLFLYARLRWARDATSCGHCGAEPIVPDRDGNCSACGVDPFLVEVVGEKQALAKALASRAEDHQRLVVELAKMLEEGFAEHTEVKYAGLFTKTISEIAVTLRHHVYRLNVHKQKVVVHRARNVRGIKLKEDALPLGDWLRELSTALADAAAESQAARAVLATFLRR